MRYSLYLSYIPYIAFSFSYYYFIPTCPRCSSRHTIHILLTPPPLIIISHLPILNLFYSIYKNYLFLFCIWGNNLLPNLLLLLCVHFLYSRIFFILFLCNSLLHPILYILYISAFFFFLNFLSSLQLQTYIFISSRFLSTYHLLFFMEYFL